MELLSLIDLYQFTVMFSLRMVGRDRKTQQTNRSNDVRVCVCTVTFGGTYLTKYSFANANSLCFAAMSCILIRTLRFIMPFSK